MASEVGLGSEEYLETCERQKQSGVNCWTSSEQMQELLLRFAKVSLQETDWGFDVKSLSRFQPFQVKDVQPNTFEEQMCMFVSRKLVRMVVVTTTSCFLEQKGKISTIRRKKNWFGVFFAETVKNVDFGH